MDKLIIQVIGLAISNLSTVLGLGGISFLLPVYSISNSEWYSVFHRVCKIAQGKL